MGDFYPFEVLFIFYSGYQTIIIEKVKYILTFY
jgi:hypothetical protein